MLTARQSLRVILGVTLGVAFFGCVGLPRRRPATHTAPPAQPVAQQQFAEPTSPPLRIPVETLPVTQQPTETAPVSPPASLTRTTFVPPDEQKPAPPAPPTAPPPPTPSSSPTLVAPTTPPVPSPQQPKSRGVSQASPEDKVDNFTELKRLSQEAAKASSTLDNYIVRLTRNEHLKGKMQPQEVILLKYRREPFSVHLKWLGEQSHGREVLYVKGQHGNEIHTRLAAGDVPFAPAGKRMALAVDSPLVKSASRHPITEAGIGRLVDHLCGVVAGMDKGDKRSGTATFLSQVKRAEFNVPVDGVEWKVPPGYDGSLPRGGTRWMYFDSRTHLPMLVVTHDERNQPVEYYHYDRIQTPVPLDNADFDPERLWTSPDRQANRR